MYKKYKIIYFIKLKRSIKILNLKNLKIILDEMQNNKKNQVLFRCHNYICKIIISFTLYYFQYKNL